MKKQTECFLVEYYSSKTWFPWRVLATLKQAKEAVAADWVSFTSVCRITPLEYGVRKKEK